MLLTPSGVNAACPDNAVIFGMSTALTGPAAHLGTNMHDGVMVALQEASTASRPLCLETLDDGYEPYFTVTNMLRLINKDKVLAVIGNVGTPTAIAAVPIANRLHTPFIGAFSGAGVLRKTPPDQFIFNFRASYAEETAQMVDALITNGGLKPKEIAFFTQRDAFGDAGFSGGLKALRSHGLKDRTLISHGRYERNSIAVEYALAKMVMQDPPPRAIIMVAAYAPSATFIKLARQYNLHSLFLNISFVGAVPLAEELGKDGHNIIITQVVPHFDSDLPLIQEYRRAINHITPSFGSLEGYIVTRMVLKAMNTINGPISRNSLVNALEHMGTFEMGLNFPLRLGPDEHQANHQVWPTIIKDGQVVNFNWNLLPALLREEGLDSTSCSP